MSRAKPNGNVLRDCRPREKIVVLKDQAHAAVSGLSRDTIQKSGACHGVIQTGDEHQQGVFSAHKMAYKFKGCLSFQLGLPIPESPAMRRVNRNAFFSSFSSLLLAATTPAQEISKILRARIA